MPPPSSVPLRSSASPAEVIKRLDLVISRRLDGLLQGEYQGLVPGHGSELGEARAYVAGDDVRRIDWNVTARMQAPYVRETIADRELETWALVDLSPSLDFGTALCEKRDLAISGLAAVGFLTARTGNRVGALVLDPRGLTTVPARGGKAHLMALLHRVVTAERVASGTTDLAAGLSRLALLSRRRGLAVVVSDFLGDGDWELALRQLTARHETLCIEVVDPRELELPNVGVLRLVDPETGRELEVQTANPTVRARYADAAAQQRTVIAGRIRRAGADHLRLRTDRDWLLDVVHFVAARRERVQRLARQGQVAP
jgi:uncharacterized protein (DUF58 family)